MRPASPRASFFATCAPGVEAVLHAEARALRLARVERQVGGVYFEGDLAAARRANLWLRTAVRVLMRVARFECPDERALYEGARAVDWSAFLAPDGRLIVDAHAALSHLAHTRFLEQRVKDAVVDQMRERTGLRPSVEREGADLGIHAHLVQDRCTLLVDTSGSALHRRGWRRAQGPAPLAETLAAAVVQLSGWDRRAPLVDPFCGSGTLLVEAALIARGVAPGLLREGFGFERWPGHDAAAWEREKAAARAAEVAAPRLILQGSDVDPERVADARANAAAAGLAEGIELAVRDARELAPRAGWNAWIVSNLPYGRRVGADGRRAGDEGDVEALYRAFGARLRERCAGSRYALLCAADGPAGALGLAGARATRMVNGGIECRLQVGEIS